MQNMIGETHLLANRVAIPVVGDEGMDSRVNPHFGKSIGFVVVDLNGENLRFLDAAALRKPSECAPISGLAEKGAKALLCLGMGRGALVRCHEAGLLVFQASGATVREALACFAAGISADFPDESICGHGGEDGCGGH